MVKTHRIIQGDYAAFKVPLLLDGVASPIAGWSLRTTVRRDSEDAAPAAELTADNGGITVHSATEWLSSFSGAVTGALEPGLYYFDHEATDPLGRPQTLERGQLIIEPQITKPST